jgi:transcriptional regulator with XRE-family HTH domain
MLDSLGATLRAAREARGWTLEEAEKATRIRTRYLTALEAGEIDSLPSPIQARGFLRSYAQYLGLNPTQVLSQLEEALKPAPSNIFSRSTRKKESLIPVSPFAPFYRLRRLFTPDAAIIAIVIIGVLGLFVWGGFRLAETLLNPSQITPTPEVIGPSPSPTLTLIANITPSATPPPPVVNFSNVQIALGIEQRAFIRVRVDDKIAFEGLVFPNERKEFTGQARVEVTTSNGAGVRVFFNQRDMGTMGGFGEVLTRAYIPSGMITPTATITFTPTITLTPSRTPPATVTPTLTRRP